MTAAKKIKTEDAYLKARTVSNKEFWYVIGREQQKIEKLTKKDAAQYDVVGRFRSFKMAFDWVTGGMKGKNGMERRQRT